jgi:hypothetical protein
VKDKTDAMNGVSSEMLSEGYEIAGKPETVEDQVTKRMKNLFDNNKALEDYENFAEMGWEVGGFLRRTDPTDRF